MWMELLRQRFASKETLRSGKYLINTERPTEAQKKNNRLVV